MKKTDWENICIKIIQSITYTESVKIKKIMFTSRKKTYEDIQHSIISKSIK